MGSERIQKVETRSGLPGLEIDGVAYHSPYDPAREARGFYSALPVEGADVVVHFGWGLGYGAEELRRRLKSDARVFVLEPEPDAFRVFQSEPGSRTTTDDSRFQFVLGPQIRQFVDDLARDGCRETDDFLWVEWPRARQMHPDLARELKDGFDSSLRDRAANLLTHFENGRLYFENAAANLPFAGDPVVGALYGRFQRVPLVLVSAGPSLDLNVHELRGMEGRAFIVSVDTALRPLLAAGIRPHAVVIADPSELNAAHIVGAVPPEAYLLAEQAVHPRAMATARRRFQFSVGVFPDGLYLEHGLERSPLQVWGSVATAALDLACRMGADPVVFVGQDFGYTWGRDYAAHTIFEGRPPATRKTSASEPDIWGRPTPTTENLIAYRDFFVRRMAAEPGRRFINATEGGILRDGAEIMSLREALHRYARNPVDVPKRLAGAHEPQRRPPDLVNHLSGVLRGRDRGCACLDGFLDLVAKRAVLEDDSEAVEELLGWGVELLAGVNGSAPGSVVPHPGPKRDPREVRS